MQRDTKQREGLEPPDPKRCQTMRPSTWPAMPSFMTFGPVDYRRCANKPSWLASDGKGEMSLCQECKDVCEKVLPATTTFLRLDNEAG
jgi:hypothetical protein